VTLEGLAWIILVNGVLEVAGLALVGVVVVRSRRGLDRFIRAVAGLVYQESEKTRARIDEGLGRRS
jgi:ABC-type phosphate transport system auxiliary subunit